MELNFASVKFALLYFPFDKTFANIPVEDIEGWNEVAYDRLKCGDRTGDIKAKYDFVTYKVKARK